MRQVDKFITKIIDYFNDESAAEIEKVLIKDPERGFLIIIHLFDKVTIDVFEALNWFILSGDYLDKDQSDKDLARFKDLLSVLSTNLVLDKLFNTEDRELNKEESTVQTLIIDKLKFLNEAIQECIKLTIKTSRRIEHYNDYLLESDNMLSPSKHINFNFSSDFSQSQALLLVLKINTILVELDHLLAVNKDQLSLLMNFQIVLNSSFTFNSTYLKIIKGKCNYLIYKLHKRLKRSKEAFLYAYELQDKYIKEDELDEISLFEPFKTVLDNHYDTNFDDKPSRNLRIDNKKLRRKWNGNVGLTSFLEYHSLIKNFKDYEKNFEELQKLVDDFTEFLNSYIPQNAFDAIAKRIALNYSLNNLFSLSIEKNKSEKLIEEQFVKIIALQEESKINNYFPYFYYCLYLNKKAKLELQKSNPELDIVNQILDKLKRHVKNCFDSYEWCKDKNFRAFQLPQAECCTTIHLDEDDAKRKIFLASSFVLPLNYMELEKTLQGIYREYKEVQSLHSFYQNILPDKIKIEEARQEITKQKETLEKEVLNRDRKQIEILSIFSAIAFFVAGNIKIYDTVSYAEEAIIILLGFTYCLGSFIILIWLITRDENIISAIRKSNFHKWLLGIYTFITIALIIILLKWPFDYNRVERIKKAVDEQRMLDSIKINTTFRPTIVPAK